MVANDCIVVDAITNDDAHTQVHITVCFYCHKIALLEMYLLPLYIVGVVVDVVVIVFARYWRDYGIRLSVVTRQFSHMIF